MKNGFTLIELLVVVLIMGILAAIALPQYINAVNKVRAKEAFQNLYAIKRAADRFQLETGATPTTFEDLDIDFSGATLTLVTTPDFAAYENGCKRINTFTYCFVKDTASGIPGGVFALDEGRRLQISMWRNYKWCSCQGCSLDSVQRTCRALGGTNGRWCFQGDFCFDLPALDI